MTDTPDVRLRHAAEPDHARIVAVVDDWFGGRRVRHLVARSWLRHFGSTSWVAEDEAGRPIGFLIGYRSQDHPAEAVVHLVAVDPRRRRRGIGRRLVAAFADQVRRDGVTAVGAVAWPGEPPSLAFFVALGFVADVGPGSRRIHGTTAFPDYDADGEDRVLFTLGTRPGA